jgi:hypothetical protein
MTAGVDDQERHDPRIAAAERGCIGESSQHGSREYTPNYG